MRRSLIPAALTPLLVVSLFALPVEADSGRMPRQATSIPTKVDLAEPQGSFVADEILVKFRPGATRAVEQTAHAAMGARVLRHISGGLDIDHLKLPPGLQVAEAVRRYSASPLVEYAEPNFYRFPSFVPDDDWYDQLWGLNNDGITEHVVTGSSITVAGEPDADMNVQEAWDTEVGDPRVVVAVLDSGVDVIHPDLAANVWVNAGENCDSTDITVPCADRTDGQDNDLSGCIDDVHGCDVTLSPKSGSVLYETDTSVFGYEHGTHVAGTIAGVTNNSLAGSGVCGGDSSLPDTGCSIMAVKVMKPRCCDELGEEFMTLTLARFLAGMDYALRMDADIINASFGGPGWSNAERDAVQTAGANGVLFVAAAGNESLDNDILLGGSPSFPASYNLQNILAVAASNHADEHGYSTACRLDRSKNNCAFSNWGRRSVDVHAPGVDILSTIPMNQYETFDGTSMAAPHVSGLAGLIESHDLANPDVEWTAVDVKNIIMNSSETSGLPLNTNIHTFLYPLPGRPRAESGQFTVTRGRVDAAKAITEPNTADATSVHDGDIRGAARMSTPRVTGKLAWPQDVNDVKRKRLTSGREYRLTLTVPSGADFDLYLYKPTAKEIWQPKPNGLIKRSFSGGSADETFTFKAGATKNYFIHVTSFFSDGTYTLRVGCLTC